MVLFALLSLSSALDIAKKFDAVTEARPFDRNALWHVLQPYTDEEGFVTKAQLKKAYDAKDEFGQPLALPPKHIMNHEVDTDHDGKLSKDEMRAWNGLSHKYCRTLGDASYGCVPKCPMGIDALNGNANYFLEKYNVNPLRNVNASRGETAMKYYAGSWTPAQKVAVEHLLASVLQKSVGGAVVQMGLKDTHSWKELRQVLLKEDPTKERELFLYDTFEGMPKCNHEFDTGMCPKVGSDKISVEMVTRDAAKIRNEPFFPQIKKFPYAGIPGNELPNLIAFAVLDGALYNNIESMLHKVYPRLAMGGKIIVHDFGWEGYPGIQKAIDTFAENTKGMKVRLPGGMDGGVACYLAEIVKVTG